jgi:prepilin-type N-terminal cleavage/methylation domain-containing protein
MKVSLGILRRGFTLIEILIGITVVSVLTSAGYVSVTNIRQAAQEQKLEGDVSSLNKAVLSYLGSGGEIPADASAAEVILKLKTRASSGVAAKTVGMTGSFIDVRVVPVSQSAEEGAGTQLRALWDASIQRFVLASEGDDGIGSFTLNEDLAAVAPATEERTVKLAASDLSSGDPVWVWDFAPLVANANTPASPPGSGSAAAVPGATPSSAADSSAPTFDVSGGTFTLTDLAALPAVTAAGAFTLTITNPNSETISYLESGSSATVSAGSSGVTISSRAISIDPDAYNDSSATIQTYTITPFDPRVAITNAGDLNPFNLGVPRASGSSASATVTATLSNWGDIPAIFQSSGNFELVMAVGSDDPSGLSGSAQETLDATLSTSSGWDFSSGAPSLIVSAMAKVANSDLFNAGTVAIQTLNATKGTLALTSEPTSGTNLNASSAIALLPSDIGNFPADYSINYTTDNSTPTTSSSTYSSPIIPPASGALILKAIAVSAAYPDWFDSTVFSASFRVVDVSAAVGVLIAGGNIANNATIQGSVILALQRDGSVPSLILNNNATVVGNIFAPGTPAVVVGNNGTVEEIVDLDGSATPDSYSIVVENGAKVGTVFRRIDPVPTLPDPIVAPTGLADQGDVSVPRNSPQTLSPGQYGSVSTSNDAEFTLGTASSSTPEVYYFEELDLRNNVIINVVGPIILYLNAPTEIKNGVVFGNIDRPEWLQINVIKATSGSNVFEVGNNGTLYAQVIAPDSDVVFSNNSTFTGGVTADYLDLVNNGLGVVFSLPPITN